MPSHLPVCQRNSATMDTVSTKAWDKGEGPALPGPAGLPGLFRRRQQRREPDPPGAVLFDMDGLLVDSEPMWTIAEQRVSRALGGEFTPELKARMIGKRIDLAVGILLEGLATPKARVADPLEVGQLLMTEMAELLADHVPLQPGAAELLDELATARIPLALVSSSYRVLVDAALTSVGAHRFLVSIAGDEVAHGKPNPEPYLTAARALGVVPARCVVLEDAPAGLQSAVAAGCACVYVPTFPDPEPLPDRVVLRSSLHEVDLALLARLAVHPNSAGRTPKPNPDRESQAGHPTPG
ncbi:MAG: HAD-superfamily hydrolase, subfamily variant 3 [Mycobacterium sp.]|nr:HAD-superfamily hydrolase, subfamily variant 3 [Mycobacterium sp.]